MSTEQIPYLRRMPLGARIGWMVTSVLVTLMESMDLLGMSIKPDDQALLRQLAPWDDVHAVVQTLTAGTESTYWGLRASVVVIAASAGLIAARFAKHLSHSLSELREAARRVAAGDLTTPVRLFGAREVEALACSIDEMRVALGDVLRLARETAALREDLALGQAAGDFLTPPRGWLGQSESERLVGFHAVNDHAAGFWWQSKAPGDRRNIVLGYVEGSGPAAVMSLAALAGAVRDELLHVEEIDPPQLVRRVHSLCSELTPRPIGLCVLTLDGTQGKGHWVAAGACAPQFLFHAEHVPQPATDDLGSGVVAFQDHLAVSLGPKQKSEPCPALRRALETALEPSRELPDIAGLLSSADMPAAVVMMQRVSNMRSQAA